MTLCKGKILIVDDLPDWRKMLSGLLSDEGYEVVTAGKTNEALELLYQKPYHVAILDLRLHEADEENRDGLTLAEEMKRYLPELAIIMLTGHADIPSIKQAMKPRESGVSIAFDFLEKDELSELPERIAAAFTLAARINPALRIELTPPLTYAQLRQDVRFLQTMALDAAQNEIMDLLQRLFHNADQVTLMQLRNGHSSAAAILVTAQSQNTPKTNVVVKFNQTDRAKREAENYTEFVKEQLGDAARAHQLDFRATAKLGGIKYSFIGAQATEFKSFGKVYATESTQQIKSIITHLFEETCANWYRHTQRPTEHNRDSLSSRYKNWLNLDMQELQLAIEKIVEQSDTTELRFQDHHRPRQSDLLFMQGISLVNPLRLFHAAFEYSGNYCITHGDLHEGNILVDNHNQTWLIDFYHTGYAHPVRDFAMLESAVRGTLQQSPAPPLVLYEWEHALLNLREFNVSTTDFPHLQLDPELWKATEITCHIRTLLTQIFPSMSPRDYLISLYFHSLKSTTLTQKHHLRQRIHSLICAALVTSLLQS